LKNRQILSLVNETIGGLQYQYNYYFMSYSHVTVFSSGAKRVVVVYVFIYLSLFFFFFSNDFLLPHPFYCTIIVKRMIFWKMFDIPFNFERAVSALLKLMFFKLGLCSLQCFKKIKIRRFIETSIYYTRTIFINYIIILLNKYYIFSTINFQFIMAPTL